MEKSCIWGLVDCLLGNSGPFASGDWILPYLTIQGSLRLNSHLNTFPSTYYFSYATKRTTKFLGFTVPSNILGIHPLLFLSESCRCVKWRHPPDVPPPFKGYRDEEWWDHDGALNTVSMTHPRFPVEHPRRFVVKDSECQPLQPGIWYDLRSICSSRGVWMCVLNIYMALCRYYKIVEGGHILFVVNRERAGVQFDLIYDSIFERCRKHAFRKIPTMPDHVEMRRLAAIHTYIHNICNRAVS
ncbi:putative alpha/Beta hydrolase [Helianthus debilis subsp. tardiflorus]